jgi:methyl-accepting chemotaxis protein
MIGFTSQIGAYSLNQGGQMKSLKQKLTLLVGLLVIIVCLSLSFTSYRNAETVLRNNTKTSITEVAKQTSNTVSGMIDNELAQLESIAARSDLKDSDESKENKIKVLNEDQRELDVRDSPILM